MGLVPDVLDYRSGKNGLRPENGGPRFRLARNGKTCFWGETT